MMLLIVAWLWIGLWFWTDRIHLKGTSLIGLVPMIGFLGLSLLLGPLNFLLEERH